jgi:hypothetical protein
MPDEARPRSADPGGAPGLTQVLAGKSGGYNVHRG